MFASLARGLIRFDLLLLCIGGGLIAIWISMLAIWLFMMRQLSGQSVMSLLRICVGRELVTKPLRVPRNLLVAFKVLRLRTQLRGLLLTSVAKNLDGQKPINS